MCQVVTQVVEVGPRPLGPDRLPDSRGVSERLVPGCDPQPVQDPPVARISMKPGGVAFVAQPGDLVEQRGELEQRMPLRAQLAGYNEVAVPRSGLARSLRNAPSENSITGRPGHSA
jgi:hypothetical protein